MTDSLTLNEMESELVREVSAFRANPNHYADLLAERLPNYEGLTLRLSKHKVLRTSEGAPACEEAIRVLRGAEAIAEPKTSFGMCKAAREAVAEHGPAGTLRGSDSDGSLSVGRLTNFGFWEGTAVEVAGFGDYTASDMLLSFLVGDADSSRAHRRALLDTTYTHMGVGAAEHRSDFKKIAILNFATHWRDK